MTTDPTYRCEELPGKILSVSLAPGLSEADWTDIEQIGADVVERLQSRERPRVIVDLSPLNHMGSAMVALVVRIWKAARERDGQMVVVNESELVGEVLEISGLASKWTIVSTREAAVEKLGGNGLRGSRGNGGSLSAKVWLGLAIAAVVIGMAGAVDAVMGGAIADEIDAVPLLGIAAGLAGLGVIAAIMAARKTDGAPQMIAVISGTFAFVLLMGSILLIVNRALWLVP